VIVDIFTSMLAISSEISCGDNLDLVRSDMIIALTSSLTTDDEVCGGVCREFGG
jgi:hypothetical protein